MVLPAGFKKRVMIPRTQHAMQSTGQSDRWQSRLRDAVITPAELLQRLNLSVESAGFIDGVNREFPLRVPPAYLAQIQPGDPDDPLLKQVLPTVAEAIAAPGYGSDPVGDLDAQKKPGLLHKYRGRVLLTLTGACAIHCRYCFRRHFPYAEANPSRAAWREVLDFIAGDKSITEVIFSGGDPLSLTDTRLAAMASDLAGIDHLKRLRIHTRLPVALPERVTDDLISWLTNSRLKPVIVIHVNHPNEIGPSAAAALARLHAAGIHLLNQSVLLKGINDHADTLAMLSEGLFEHDVLPYYLHQLDAVEGAAHFAVPDAEALALMETLRERLPGYLVPGLVREVTGAPYKLPLL